MNIDSLVNATVSLKKREGDLLPFLKAVFFEQLKLIHPVKTVKDLLVGSKGGSWGNNYFKGSIGAKVLRSPDIRFGFIDSKNAEERYFNDKELENFRLKNNDILVIKSNGSLDLVGKCQIFKDNKDYSNVIASNFLMVLSPNEELVYPDYLELFLKSPQALVWRYDTQKTTTGLRNLDSKGFLNIEVPVPKTIAEQKRLFNQFNRFLRDDFDKEENHIQEFFELVNSKERLTIELTNQLSLVKQLRQAFLREAMQGTLVPQDSKDEPASELLKKIKAEKEQLTREKKIKKEKELAPIKPEEIPFEIPKSWAWCRLGEISQSANNGLYKPERFYKPEGIISLRMFNIQDGKIDLSKVRRLIVTEEELKTYYLEKDDILVNRVNGIDLVGKAAIIEKVNEPLVYESMNIRLRLIFKNEVAKFINWMLLDKRAREYFYNCAKVANGQVSINQTHLGEFLVPFPPISEQYRIIAKIEQLMRHCDELEQSIKESQTQNDQLLQQVLREALQPKNEYMVSEELSLAAESVGSYKGK